MSRDPDDHSPYISQALHKYPYAEGDPINTLDPTGRGGDSVELTLLDETPLPVLREVLIQGAKVVWKKALIGAGAFALWCKVDDTVILLMKDIGLKAEKDPLTEHACTIVGWFK